MFVRIAQNTTNLRVELSDTTGVDAPPQLVAGKCPGEVMSEVDEQNAEPDSHVDANGSTGESIDQIREILFGNQSRTIDDRFDKLNDRMSEAIGGLRSLLTERTDAISQRLEKEMHHLRGELEESRDDADQKRSDLNERLNSITNDLRQQVGSLSENLSAAERSLRSDMDNGLSALKQQLISQMDTVRDQLDANISQVSNASVARKSLSAALRELSERIDAD